MIAAVRGILGSLIVVFLTFACSGQPSTVVLANASVDPTHWCPGNANNAPYDVHATVGVHNGTSSTVTIDTVTATMALQAVGGEWLEKTGEVYDAGAAAFAPASVRAGGDATLKVTIHSACTSPAYGTGPGSFGDYRINMRIATSAGTYSISTGNLHRIETA